MQIKKKSLFRLVYVNRNRALLPNCWNSLSVMIELNQLCPPGQYYSVNYVGAGFKEHTNCGVITYCVDPQKQKNAMKTYKFSKIKAR